MPVKAKAATNFHIDILTPSEKTYTDDEVTDENGSAAFSFYPRKGNGQEIYTLMVTASEAGCESGSDSPDFYVYKPSDSRGADG